MGVRERAHDAPFTITRNPSSVTRRLHSYHSERDKELQSGSAAGLGAHFESPADLSLARLHIHQTMSVAPVRSAFARRFGDKPPSVVLYLAEQVAGIKAYGERDAAREA
jgi:hypothetical protein